MIERLSTKALYDLLAETEDGELEDRIVAELDLRQLDEWPIDTPAIEDTHLAVWAGEVAS